MKNMNQRRILVIPTATMLVTLLMTTVVTFSVRSSFAQNVNNEDDDTTNIDNALTKLKNSIICNIAKYANECNQESHAGIEIGEEVEVEAPPLSSSPPPADSDNDEVPDSVDGCPNQPGPAANNGCPVTPGDGGVGGATNDHQALLKEKY
jgi:hypothetical protein